MQAESGLVQALPAAIEKRVANSYPVNPCLSITAVGEAYRRKGLLSMGRQNRERELSAETPISP